MSTNNSISSTNKTDHSLNKIKKLYNIIGCLVNQAEIIDVSDWTILDLGNASVREIEYKILFAHYRKDFFMNITDFKASLAQFIGTMYYHKLKFIPCISDRRS